MLSFVPGNESIWVLYVGTGIFALSTPLSLNSISMISNLWFPDNQRTTATAIMGLSRPLGLLVGLAITGILAAGINKDD